MSGTPPLFRSIHRFFAIFIAPTVISCAARKLSHISCTSDDIKIMNRHQMQPQLQTQEGWWRHAEHMSDQLQENLSDPDTPFNAFFSPGVGGREASLVELWILSLPEYNERLLVASLEECRIRDCFAPMSNRRRFLSYREVRALCNRRRFIILIPGGQGTVQSASLHLMPGRHW